MSSTVAAGAQKPGRFGGAVAPGRSLAAFRHRDFRVLLSSTMALQVGSWVQTIGMGWLVLHDLGGSATDLGVVALLRGASTVFLSPVSGFLASKLERRKQLVAYTTTSALIAALLAVLITAGQIELWVVYCIAVFAGVVEALAGPIRVLLVYDTVGPEDLTNAVALNALGGNAMRVVGPAIGGGLIGAVGTQGAFQMQAVCLALAAILTLRLRPAAAEPSDGSNMFRSIAGGIAYVARDRRMLVLLAMAVVPSLLVYPYITFLPVFARDVLNSGETGYGYLAAAAGIGSLLGGALVAATAGRERMGPIMVWSCVLYIGGVGAFTASGNLWLSVGILAVAGLFHSVYSALNASLMQLKADPAYRSRTMSLHAVTWGLSPFSALLMGRMIDHWSAPPVVAGWMAIAGGLTLAIALLSREMRQV